MKTVFILSALLACAGCATTAGNTAPALPAGATPQPPVYYTGNNEPVRGAAVRGQSPAAAGNAELPACPAYLTGNNEPAASTGCAAGKTKL
ncbi:MAG: hypothetical protein LBI89_00330 [Prevotellaceae bacterium]|nr:hypothetical protein [Prevotellaceae bacterium]